MKWKTPVYIILLILTFFIPLKTADYIINKDVVEEKEEKDWVEETNIDTTNMKEVEKEEETVNQDSSTTIQDRNNWWEYPDNIYTTKRDGNDLLVLVNKQYKLLSTYAPRDLVLASESAIRRLVSG